MHSFHSEALFFIDKYFFTRSFAFSFFSPALKNKGRGSQTNSRLLVLYIYINIYIYIYIYIAIHVT